jgi:hypothetical protein
MSIMEDAVRDLMDALLASHYGLKDVDPAASIDDNVTKTGVSERCVKAYMLGLRALER